MLSSLIDRLKTAPELKTVAVAWELSPVDDIKGDAPACYVIPLGEKAGDNIMDNAVRQRVATDWALFLVCGVEDLDAVRTAVRKVMLGWVPDNAVNATVFVEGEVLDIKGSYLWWRDVYRIDQHISA